MVAKCVGLAKDQFCEYQTAMQSFGHNAKRFLISGFLQGLGGGMLATVLGIYIKTAGMPERIVGYGEAGVAAAAAAVALLGTPLIAVLGYRFLMVAAVALIVGSRIGMASIPMAGAIIGFSLAVGLGDGFMRTVGSAFMSENSGEGERTHLFSVEFLVRVAAGLLGGLGGGFLPTLLSDHMPMLQAYQWTITISAVIIGTGILPMLSMRENRDKTSVAEAYKDSFRALRSWRKILRLVGPQAAIALGGGMVIPFVPLYLSESLHANIGQVGTILGLSSMVTAFGVFGTPVIARKLGLPTGVALLQGLSVPFLAMVSLATSLPMAIGALWIRGAMMNMAGPLYNQLAMEGTSDREKPLFAGWMFFGLNMMWLAGNVIGGRLMEVSYRLPYLFAVVLYATGAISTFLVWRVASAKQAKAEAVRVGAALPEAA